MPTKMVLFFNQLQGGFSETFYHTSDDPQTLATTLTNDFYQKAANLRATSTILKAARFSRIGGAKLSILVRPFPIAQGKRATVAVPGPDPISTTAVYLLQATNGNTRRLFMRGLADVDVERDNFGNDLESSALMSGRNAYFAALFQLGFQVQVTQKPPFLGLTWRNVVRVRALTPSVANRCEIRLFPEAPNFAVNDMLDFAGAGVSLPRFPRRTRILGISVVDGVANYQIAYALPGGVTVEPQNMRCQILPKLYAPISLWYFERFSEHKTGRPFGSLRGRARATQLRQ
jgi:hypothetical protein